MKAACLKQCTDTWELAKLQGVVKCLFGAEAWTYYGISLNYASHEPYGRWSVDVCS